MTDLAQIFGEYNETIIRWNENPNFPIWVGVDVGDALGLVNVRQTISNFEDDEKAVIIVDTPGGKQEMLGVTEAGLFRLIFKSRKKGAKLFQRWVFHEVLPEIRKTGSYSLQPQPQQPELPSWEKAVKVANAIEEIQDTLSNQPRLAQFLTDQAMATYTSTQSQLAGTPLRGVAEIAEEMELPVSDKNRIQLGKFVKSQLGDIAVKEKRMCNGVMRPINCYEDTPEVRESIANFFDVVTTSDLDTNF